jgi:hypothetical protein
MSVCHPPLAFRAAGKSYRSERSASFFKGAANALTRDTRIPSEQMALSEN